MTTATLPDRLLTEDEAADVCNIKPQTLAAWRLRGCGPTFLKLGRSVRYDERDLAAFLASRRCNNTAEADAIS